MSRQFHCGNDNFLNKCYLNNWIAICRNLCIDFNLTLYTKINWKWIIDLNIKCKTFRKKKITMTWIMQRVLRQDTKSISIKNYRLESFKIKNFFSKSENTDYNWEEIFANHTFKEDLYPQCINNSQNSTIKNKQPNQKVNKKFGHITKKIWKIANKRCSISFPTREMQV